MEGQHRAFLAEGDSERLPDTPSHRGQPILLGGVLNWGPWVLSAERVGELLQEA